MAIYRCSKCDRFVNDDWEPGTEDPEDGYELMCESCSYENDAKQDALTDDPAYDKWVVERQKDDLAYRRKQSCQ